MINLAIIFTSVILYIIQIILVIFGADRGKIKSKWVFVLFIIPGVLYVMAILGTIINVIEKLINSWRKLK